MTLKSVNIHTKNRIPDIQHHKKGVKRNYLVVVCSRHHKYFNGISFYHENTRWSFIEFNHPGRLLTLSPSSPVSKNSSECGSISTCIFGSVRSSGNANVLSVCSAHNFKLFTQLSLTFYPAFSQSSLSGLIRSLLCQFLFSSQSILHGSDGA